MQWRNLDQFQLASDLKTNGVGWLQVQNWAGNVTACGCGGVDDAKEGAGVKVQSSGFRVQGSEFRVQELVFRVKGLKFRS